jgi:hypothetical protein
LFFKKKRKPILRTLKKIFVTLNEIKMFDFWWDIDKPSVVILGILTTILQMNVLQA